MIDFETKYRDLVAGVEALAETWPMVARALGPSATVTPAECYDDAAADLRALLASSPAEREGEELADITFNRMPKSSKVVATFPAPVSSDNGGRVMGESLKVVLTTNTSPVAPGHIVATRGTFLAKAREAARDFEETSGRVAQTFSAPAPVSSGEAGNPTCACSHSRYPAHYTDPTSGSVVCSVCMCQLWRPVILTPPVTPITEDGQP